MLPIVLVIYSFWSSSIAFVRLSLWYWELDVDLIVSVPEFIYLLLITTKAIRVQQEMMVSTFNNASTHEGHLCQMYNRWKKNKKTQKKKNISSTGQKFMNIRITGYGIIFIKYLNIQTFCLPL